MSKVKLLDGVCWGKVARVQFSKSGYFYCLCGDETQTFKGIYFLLCYFFYFVFFCFIAQFRNFLCSSNEIKIKIKCDPKKTK